MLELSRQGNQPKPTATPWVLLGLAGLAGWAGMLAILAHTGATPAALAAATALFAAFGATATHLGRRPPAAPAAEDPAAAAQHWVAELPCPAILLNDRDEIVAANTAFRVLLELADSDETPATLASVVASHHEKVPERYAGLLWLQRGESPPRPVLPATAPLHPATEPPLKIMTFSDLSRALKLEQKLEKAERIHEATRVAGDLAHEIRTPLTAISASIQLLRRYEEKATASDWLPHSPKRLDRYELFAHIEDASERMNAAVTNFINFADFSPSDLLSIIKLDYTEENKG